MSTSTSSTSGSTATVAAEVWMRPCVSVSGTRCTRCTPDSNFSLAKAPRPFTSAMISLKPPTVPSEAEITSTLQPCKAANFSYIRNRSPANSEASSPPVPARISSITLRSSIASFGSSATRIS